MDSKQRRTLAFLVGSLVGAFRNANVHAQEECPCALLPQPTLSDKEATARWMVHSLEWGVLSTISTRLDSTIEDDGTQTVHSVRSETTASNNHHKVPVPFGNVYSFADGACHNSTGTPYFYGTYIDQTFLDSLNNAAVSLTLTETAIASACRKRSAGTTDSTTNNDGKPVQVQQSCSISSTGFGDPENPVCGRLVLSGILQTLDQNNLDDEAEYNIAKTALFQRHPSMKEWPINHHWVFAKIDIQDIWLIDYFGGASILDVDAYYAATLNEQQYAEEEEEG